MAGEGASPTASPDAERAQVVDPETEPLSEEVKKLASKSRPLLIKFFQTAD